MVDQYKGVLFAGPGGVEAINLLIYLKMYVQVEKESRI